MLPTARRLIAPALLLVLAVLPNPTLGAQAQDPGAASSRRMATRPELEAAAEEFDRLAASTAYSAPARTRARIEAAALRRRLAEGDFHVGDRLLLRIEGQVMLDDTVSVVEGPQIMVRGIRQVSLAGALRSELETLLRAEVNEVVPRSTVTASPLMRVSVLGSVTRPGFLSVPSTTTLDRLITLSGGPAANAAIDRITLERADTVIVTQENVQRAMAAGSTLEALGLLDGDALKVPLQSPPLDRTQTITLITSLVIPLLTIFLVRR